MVLSLSLSSKFPTGLEVDLDSAGNLYALYQVDQRVHEAEVTDTGGDEGPGDIPDLADSMVNIACAAIDEAQPFLVSLLASSR